MRCLGGAKGENSAPVKNRGHHKTEQSCIKLSTGQAAKTAVWVEGGNRDVCLVESPCGLA